MGLGIWWITHGPGSPGSVAKSMAKAYSRIKAYYPKASKDELLLITLRTRYSESEINHITADEIVKECDGSLAHLTLKIIMYEIPAATGAMLNAPRVYSEMLNVVHQVTSRFAPEA